MIQTKKKKRGGKRKGAGRPKTHPTKIITFRLRHNWEDRIRKVVKDEIIELKKIDA